MELLENTLVSGFAKRTYEIELLISGDSIQNILGDLFSCGLGYVFGTLFAALGLWWVSLVWIVASEVTTDLETIINNKIT